MQEMPMAEFRHISFIWPRDLISLSPHTATILTDASRDIPQPLQINARTVNFKVKTATLHTFIRLYICLVIDESLNTPK
jgi:hypothetical protein